MRREVTHDATAIIRNRIPKSLCLYAKQRQKVCLSSVSVYVMVSNKSMKTLAPGDITAIPSPYVSIRCARVHRASGISSTSPICRAYTGRVRYAKEAILFFGFAVRFLFFVSP